MKLINFLVGGNLVSYMGCMSYMAEVISVISNGSVVGNGVVIEWVGFGGGGPWLDLV